MAVTKRSHLLLILAFVLLSIFVKAEFHDEKKYTDVAVENEEDVEEFFNNPSERGQDVNAQQVSKPKEPVHACWKEGEPRGSGKFPDKETRECPSTQEKSMGLCYPHCGESRIGFGPLCLDNCAKTMYKSNGIVFCCETDDICKQLVQDLAMKLPKSLVRFALDLAAHPNDVRRILRDFREFASNAMQLKLPLCPSVKDSFEDDFEEEDNQEAIQQAQDVQARIISNPFLY